MMIRIIGFTGSKILNLLNFKEEEARKIVEFYSDHKNFTIEYIGVNYE